MIKMDLTIRMKFASAALAASLLLLGSAQGSNAQAQLKAPGKYLDTSGTLLNASDTVEKATSAETASDWAGALTLWERVVDRTQASPEQIATAHTHLKALRSKVARNLNVEKARPWTVLAVIFRHLDFSWTDGDGKLIEVHKTVSAADEAKIRGSLSAFSKHVMRYTSGQLRLDMDIRVIDSPLTKLAGSQGDKPPFSPAPHLVRPFITSILKERKYDTVMAYVKYDSDQGPTVQAPFAAATYGSIGDFDSAGFTMVPWRTIYPLAGETDGEMELHEWLHQIQSMFVDVLRYPQPITENPDGGRVEGDNRPGGDSEFARLKSETTWIRFYQHIMEDHYTRQMWSEATMRPIAGKPLSGEVIKPKQP